MEIKQNSDTIRNLDEINKYTNDSNIIKATFSYENNSLEQKEFLHNVDELNHLIKKIEISKKKFIDYSRLYCCSCTALCTLTLLIVFYIFDVVKYNIYCEKSEINNNNNDDNYTNSSIIEYCDAPALSFWTRFTIITVLTLILTLSLYCSGKTVLVFDPRNNILSINKQKLYFLPSINYYTIENLEEAIIESDMSTFDGPKISTFSFYAVTLIFKKERVGLGFGRDCFFLYSKLKLMHNINKYLRVLRESIKWIKRAKKDSCNDNIGYNEFNDNEVNEEYIKNNPKTNEDVFKNGDTSIKDLDLINNDKEDEAIILVNKDSNIII